MPRSSKWKVKYGFCELEILWTHKQVMLSRYPGGHKKIPQDALGKPLSLYKPEQVNMSTKGFSVIAKGFLKRWDKFKRSKKYRRYTS